MKRETGCYFLKLEPKMNWDDARKFCTSMDDRADLAIISSSMENQAINEYMAGVPGSKGT